LKKKKSAGQGKKDEEKKEGGGTGDDLPPLPYRKGEGKRGIATCSQQKRKNKKAGS